MNWKRIFLWSLLIFVVVQIVGFCSGLSLARWEIYGGSSEQAIENARLVRRIAVAVVTFVLYLLFLRPIAKAKVLHALAVFALVQAIDIILSYALTRSVPELADLYVMGRGLLICLLAVGAAALSSNYSLKRTAASRHGVN